MWLIAPPSEEKIASFLNEQQRRDFSYPEVGHTRKHAPRGYNIDHNRILLGHGAIVFASACQALRSWTMFPSQWTRVTPLPAPLEEGRVVALVVQAYGLWWLNACRIVYPIDESTPVRRYGFAYGTLPGHVERGEERFSIEWLPDDTVWYDLYAFSQPHYWLARLAKPLARGLQRRFATESKRAMAGAIREPAL